MHNINKQTLVKKIITVTFEEIAYPIEIFKYYSPTDIYRTIHKAISPTSNIRITGENDALLELRFETLHNSSKILAHRSEYIEQGPGSHSVSGKKAPKLLGMIMQEWGVKDMEDILPQDLRPRVSPRGREQLATLEDSNLGISFTSPETWPAVFVRMLYNLSKVTVNNHEMAVQMLRYMVAERHASKDQHRKVQEVMSGDVRKAVARREAQLMDLASEGYDVALFAGGLGDAIQGVEKEAREAEAEKEAEATNSFVLSYRGGRKRL